MIKALLVAAAALFVTPALAQDYSGGGSAQHLPYNSGYVPPKVNVPLYWANPVVFPYGATITGGSITAPFTIDTAVLSPIVTLRANNLSDLSSASAARTNLGLGSIATQAASAVAITGGALDNTPIGQTTTAPAGFTITAAGNLSGAGVSDGSALSGNYQSAVVRPLSSSANESSMVVQGVTSGSGYTGNTEKNGIYSRVTGNEQSDVTVSPFYFHDSVAIEAQGVVAAANTKARVWGIDSLVTIPAGADGYANAIEAEVYNNGTSQTYFNQQTGKYALHIVSGGSVPATAVMFTGGGSANNFLHGIVFDKSNMNGPVLEVLDLTNPLSPGTALSIDKSGGATFNGTVFAVGVTATQNLTIPFGTPTTSTSSCNQGQIQVDATYIYTCVATNVWHRVANGTTW